MSATAYAILSQRFPLSLLLGLLCGLLCWWFSPEQALTDLHWAYSAAVDLCAGRDPYRHVPSIALVPYPLTAALPFLLLLWLPERAAVALFMALSCGVLAWAAGDC